MYKSHRRYIKSTLGEEGFHSYLLPPPQSKDRINRPLICFSHYIILCFSICLPPDGGVTWG